MQGQHKDWIMKGYRYIYRPDHPSAHRGGLLDGRILEHRLIAEDMLGRQLDKEESVHHIDRNRLNNDPSNLMIVHNRAHSAIHKFEERGVEPILDSVQFAHDGISMTYATSDNYVHAFEHAKCLNCGADLSIRASAKSITGLCQKCFKEKNAEHIPSRDALIAELRGKSMEEVGRAHGVSGRAIRKWVDKYDINIHGLTKPVGFTKEAMLASRTDIAREKCAKSVSEFWHNHIHPSSRPVEQLTFDGKIINAFCSAVKASEAFGGNDGSPIIKACKHNVTYKGYRWRYKQ